MIIYDKCSNIEFEKVYQGFKSGFSDYIIKIEISKEDFMKRFFGPEGNKLEYSFIALDGGKPVGLILGGIKVYEGVNTLRCGTLCIHPEYRGKGISKALFGMHKEVALNHDCKQMFLEVIVGNDRAIKFYRRLGYSKVYDISYYSHKDPSKLQRELTNSMDIRKVEFETILNLADKINDVHVNWQNDFDYMKKTEDLVHYGIYQESKLIGALSITIKGKIFFIWTNPQYRHKGSALSLIKKATQDLKLNTINISFPNNASIEGFLNHIKFEKDNISQYEMYLII
ncbi:Ribosomal protein S18 acetylase RimI [Clostridium amylolyticum]|uniref:Ribosomal protein S18 acetylase RimI n=1 Tax=Clostridium amylolyticum TaxID=1121298 RepID=A0A1M6H6M0_9CLOT|nr:GNAT family N-acetyltransferase [Clostridium amylolyticum]SHJ17887.1 Ribosomal protein S18 acetylase RimI [Clostridium amylolyticum]